MLRMEDYREQHKIKKTHQHETNSHQDLTQTALLLIKTASTLSHWCKEHHFRPNDIAPIEAIIMTSIGDRTMTITELVEESIVPSCTLSRAVSRMVEKNLLRKEYTDEDKRKVSISATPVGLALRSDVLECVGHMGNGLLSHLSNNEVKSLNGVLRSILKNTAKTYRGYKY